MKHNTFKKLMAVLLCMMMAVSTLVIVPMSVSAAWDGLTITDWTAMQGTGTEADPYLIATPADYASMVVNAGTWAATENQYFKITADLDFGGMAPGSISNATLAIKLDGDNHVLSNMVVTYSLFDSVQAGTSFKNLHFVNFQSGRDGNTGGLIQNNPGATTFENVTFDNTSKMEIFATSGYAAAFVCDARADLTFKNCVNAASVKAANYGGAYIGYLRKGVNVTFENCANYGPVTVGSAEYTSDVHAGGFIGGMGPEAYNVTFTNCVNAGKVMAMTTKQNAGNSAAGFVGTTDYAAKQAGASAVTFNNCYNSGTITGIFPTQADFKYPTGNIGGIIGYNRYGGTVNLNGVYSTGTVSNFQEDSNAWTNAIIGTGTNPELLKNLVNVYAIFSETYTNAVFTPAEGDTPASPNAPAYGGTYCVHGFTVDGEDFVTYAYCDLVESVDATIKLATAAGADEKIGSEDDTLVESTIAAEIAKIDAAVPAHTYDDDCDEACNICGTKREAPHAYENACDAKCDACETERTPAEHVYDDDTDATCNVCGAERTVTPPTSDDPTDDPADDNKPEDEKPEDDKKEDDTTTKAPDTTKASAGGCGGSIAGVGALLALTATFGFAFVGKKED